MKIKEIYEGWRNKLIPPAHLKDIIEIVRNERMAICNGCEFNSKNVVKKPRIKRPDVFCVKCGCTLSAKTSCLSCRCPINKWGEELREEDEEYINTLIYG